VISSLTSLLSSVQQKIARDFPDSLSLATLSTTVLDAPSWRVRQPRHPRTPGYYDANAHTIYLNKTVLEDFSTATIATIYYHELLHALSFHRIIKKSTARIFQSGVRLETYSFTGRCQVKHGRLNEGIVQYFSNEFTDNVELAYNNEVMAVSIVVTYLGRAPFLNALLEGDIHGLETMFDACFGDGAFHHFSEALDARQYNLAISVIATPVVAVTTLPTYNDRQLALSVSL
jgi:hypothetical protein